MLDTSCPVCGTPHARKLSITFAEGRGYTHSTSQSVGKTNGLVPITIKSQGSTEGFQQSNASAEAAPPFVPNLIPAGKRLQIVVLYGWMGLSMLIALALISAGTGFLQTLGTVFVLLLLSIPLGGMISDKATPDEIARHRERHKDAFAALDRWEKTFACGSCAHRFIPNSAL